MRGEDPRIIALIMALRKTGVTDARVLSAIEDVPRDAFVAEPFRHAAYDNTALPIQCGQTISQPYVVACATIALEVGPAMRILEIGTGSGYQAAVLAKLCRRVYSIERHKPLMKEAEARLKALKIDNVVTWYDDGMKGWPQQAPFDRILLSAAVESVPPALFDQLKVGGILVAPVGPVGGGPGQEMPQQLTKYVRTEQGVVQEALIPVMFVPMLAGVA
ncbi:MAG: protein-L-isoaspartate(D-aspartate) O-methyltransferase [Rhizomicrobium sp.]